MLVPAPPADIATAVGRRIDLYDRPGPQGWQWSLRSPNRYGDPRVFRVLAVRDGWVRVLTPRRPNGTQAWLRADQVRLSAATHRVTIKLRGHALTVRRAGLPPLRMPIGVGTAGTPTPAGRFFLISVSRMPRSEARYGPYALGLSGHSTVLRTFLGGDGRIGLHGTDRPKLIGRDVSHGCIRLHNRHIRRLARILPLGTPVDIIR